MPKFLVDNKNKNCSSKVFPKKWFMLQRRTTLCLGPLTTLCMSGLPFAVLSVCVCISIQAVTLAHDR